MTLHAYLLVGAMAAVSTALSAQGIYGPFGDSCPGAPVCGSANANATGKSSSLHDSNIYALLVPPSPFARVVTGFQLLTTLGGATPRPLTIQTQIYAANAAGAPTGAALRTGTMFLRGFANWESTTFATAYVLPANTKLFLSYTPVARRMTFPIASTGNKVTHFWRRPNSATWNGTPPNGFRTSPWAWKLNCGGIRGPILSHTGVPTINTTFTVDLTGAPPNANGIFALGVRYAFWDLTPANAPGCTIYTSLDFLFGIRSSSRGTHSFRLTVPNNSALMGFRFYNQYAISDPSANGLGVAFSNGGAGTVG